MIYKLNSLKKLTGLICAITLVFSANLASAQSAEDTEKLDPRFKEVVDSVEEHISQANNVGLRGQSSVHESGLTTNKKLVAIDRVMTATYSNQPEEIRSAVKNFQKLEANNSTPEMNRIAEMYLTYADAVENGAGFDEKQKRIERFQNEGSWLERYLALRLSVRLHANNKERQSALQNAQIALNIIPKDLNVYTAYAKADIASTTAQLHNWQGNTDLALDVSLDYLRLTERDPDAKTALDLINNLIYSTGLNRNHEAAIYLSERLFKIEESETSEIPGLSEYRIAQVMNMSGEFEKGLSFSEIALSKGKHPFVQQGASVMKATALAGLGRKSEALAITRQIDLDLSENYLLERETRRDPLYLAFLLAQGENNDLAFRLYNRQIDVTSQKLLSESARETTSMLASLENSRERQEERAAAAAREAALLELTIIKQRRINRALMALLALAALTLIGLAAFLKFRERTMKELAIKRKEAASADKLKTEFLGVISHELRTPLNGIIGFSDLLAQTHSDPDVRKKTSVILQSGQELLDVVESMTDMARIDAGHLNVLLEETDVPALLSGAVAPYQVKAEAKGVALTHFIDPALNEHLVDGPRLQQCVATLLSNAVSFTVKGRIHMHVTTQKDASDTVTGVNVIVADTGVGMTELVQSRLFTPFMQADTSLRRSHMGTGLSLAIAKALATLMGGDLTVISRKDRGSEFTLTVPLEASSPALEHVEASDVVTAQDDAVEAVEPTTLPPPVLDLMQPVASQNFAPLHTPPHTSGDEGNTLEGLRVLIVDDIISNRNVVRQMLEDRNCICFEAPNGEDALKALHTGPVDVVIMDVHMNRLDGVETTRRIRESGAPFADVPIIALTADNAATTNAACMAAGADIFLTKPVLSGELCRALAFLQTGPSQRTLSRVEAG